MGKIAACYTVFNGEELLQSSMQQIDGAVDLFVICYQEISNKGNKNVNLMAVLNALKAQKPIIFIEFQPNFGVNTKENERIKHQLMLETARKNGSSHVLLAACDHFYDKNQFKNAVIRSIFDDFDVTFTSMFTYYKHPEWQLTPKEDYYMPFIIKLHPSTKITRMKNYPYRVDPSVQVNTIGKTGLFDEKECILHHYSMIRENLGMKLNNAAASIRWNPEDIGRFTNEFLNYDIKENPGVSYFQGRKVKIVPNYFNI